MAGRKTWHGELRRPIFPPLRKPPAGPRTVCVAFSSSLRDRSAEIMDPRTPMRRSGGFPPRHVAVLLLRLADTICLPRSRPDNTAAVPQRRRHVTDDDAVLPRCKVTVTLPSGITSQMTHPCRFPVLSRPIQRDGHAPEPQRRLQIFHHLRRDPPAAAAGRGRRGRRP